ncbi:MAG: putative toxin-antitoxin system toxin component, PIN family [Desulfobacterales bacterium]|nr:putative toxin-antitoxin system toxin component, PIN family [Desulfobacterales bacterium]
MIKVVLDTNVFVSSFFGGNPRKVIDLWKTGEITLCLSKAIMDEYVEVLGRLGLQNERELRELLSLLARGFHIHFTARTHKLHIVNEDPEDDKFIECAVALNAEVVVTGDRALRAIQNYMGIRIVTPKDFLDAFMKPRRLTVS